jgi:hypothetical protein
MKPIRDLDLEGIAARVFDATDATRRIAVDNLIQMQLPKTPARDRGLRLVRNHLALAITGSHTMVEALSIQDPLVRAFVCAQSHPYAGELPSLPMVGGVDAAPHLRTLVASHPELEWDPERVQRLILESIRLHGHHEVDEGAPPWLMDFGPAVGASALFRLVTLRKLGELPGRFDAHEHGRES